MLSKRGYVIEKGIKIINKTFGMERRTSGFLMVFLDHKTQRNV